MYLILGIATLFTFLTGSFVYVASSKYQAKERLVAAFLRKSLKVLAGTAAQTVPEESVTHVPGGNPGNRVWHPVPQFPVPLLSSQTLPPPRHIMSAAYVARLGGIWL